MGEIEIQGPDYYLARVLDAMREFHKDHGYYPSMFDSLASYMNLNNPFKGEGFEYEIVYADEKSFLVVSHNNRDLRDYQITEKSFVPTWLFKDEKRRKEELEKLIEIIDQNKDNPPLIVEPKDSIGEINILWKAILDLRNFSYEEAGEYLFKLMQETEDDQILICAIYSLSMMEFHPSQRAIDRFAKILDQKGCPVIFEESLIDMLSRAIDKDAIEASTKLLEWILNNCEESKVYHFHDRVEKAIISLKDRLKLD